MLNVSMLWESTDASTALHDRFGFGDPDDVARWLTSTLSSTWALHVVECDRVTISDQNAIAWVGTDRGPFVVKWSRAERLFPKLAGIADLIHALAEKGVPVAGPVASLDGSRRVVLSQGSTPLSVTVQPTMPGTHLDVADDAAVHAAGACLARLHDAMAGQRVAEVTSPARASAVDLREAIQTWLDVDDPLTHPDASACSSSPPHSPRATARREEEAPRGASSKQVVLRRAESAGGHHHPAAAGTQVLQHVHHTTAT